MENSTNTSEGTNSDISEVKPSLQAVLDSGKPSSVFVNPGSPIKKETPDSCEEVVDGGKDSVFADRNNRDQVKIESSSDESSCSNLKYDKDEPELKGPITSYPQYQEYVQEYQDKYECYLSLKKILEAYSDEFEKLAVKCEDAKARGDKDRYNEIWEEIKESYKPRYDEVKKMFAVLHAELASIRQRVKDAVDERRKRSKAGNLTPEAVSPSTDVQTFEKSRNLSPFKFTEGTSKDPNIQAGNRADRQGSSDVGFQKGNNQALTPEAFSPSTDVQTFEKSRNLSPFIFTAGTSKDPNIQAGNRDDRQGSSDVGFQKGSNQALLQTGQRSSDEVPRGVKKKYRKHSVRDFHAHELSSEQKDKSHEDARNELSVSNDSNSQKQGEIVGKLKEGRQDTQSKLGASPKDNNRTDLGTSLQREFSDLELGEFRESTPGNLSRIGSFKDMENKTNTSEDTNTDTSKVIPALKAILDSAKPSSVPIKMETPDSWEEVADGGKESVFADRNNRFQVKIESSSDENSCSYSMYDKDAPELKGPITSYPQYQEYGKEFQHKYDSYLSLVKILDDYCDEFKKLASGNMDTHNEIKELIKETHRQCNVSYMELSSIKQRMEDFVKKYKKD